MSDVRLKDKAWRIDNLYKIRNKAGQLVKFKRNRAQKHFNANLHRLNIILKSRQLGFTTDESIDSLDDTLFIPNIDALLIAHNLDAGEGIFDKKIEFAWEQLKPELKALWGVDTKTSKTLKFDFGEDKNGKSKGFSSIAVDTSGRSGTYQRVHVTELAEISKKFPKKVPDIIEGTFPAVPSDGRIDVESTSQGASGEFYDMFWPAWEWQQEHPNEPLSPYQWKAHFYNWTWDDEALDKITEPIPFEVMEQGEKFKEYAQKHNLTPVQATYYYQKWLSLNKKWNALKREYPTTPQEAFEAISEGTFYGEQIGLMEQNGQVGVFPHQKELKVHTVWDLGVGKNMKVGFFQRDTVNNRVRMIDHLSGEGSEGLPELIAKVKNKPYVYGKHFGPHDLETTDIGSGKTRWETAKSLGLKFDFVPDELIEDGINAVMVWLSRLDVDKEKCGKDDNFRKIKSWVTSMKNYQREWDEKRGQYKDEPLHDWASHDADMARYAALVEKKMTNDSQLLNRPFYDAMDAVWEGESSQIERYQG